MDLDALKFPIGPFQKKDSYTLAETDQHIQVLEDFPEKLKKLVKTLSDTDLNKTYRPEGWTVRQVVHHLADSHINMYIRVRLALTEENPTVKGYNEKLWAELADVSLPIEPSLSILEGVHERIVHLFKTLNKESLQKTFYHGGYQKTYVLQDVIALYAWHSEHHYQHIIQAIR